MRFTLRPLSFAIGAALALFGATAIEAIGQGFSGPAIVQQPLTINHCLKVKSTNGNTLVDSGGACGGSGSPGGSNTQVQYNNSGSFGGITGATTNGTTLTLVAPILGTPASGNAANITNLQSANLSGAVPVNKGGTGATSAALANLTAITGCTGTPSGTTFLRGDCTWSTPAGSGTVTSAAASFTGGLVSIAGSPITTTGTFAFTVAGTSGGIPYFSSASAWATSAALTANNPVIGGGAGVAPSSGTRVGNTTVFATGTGSFISGNGLLTDVNHNLVDAGYVPAPPGSGAFLTAGATLTMAQFNTDCRLLTVNGAAQTINLPALATPSTAGCYIITTPFNQTVTVHPNGTDKVNGVNANVTVAANFNSIVTAEATTGWGVPIGPSGGSGLANPITVAVTDSYANLVSAPAFKFTGALFTGGSGTTTMPALMFQPTAATARTDWSTAGTWLGVNAAAGFSGNFLDFSIDNGGSVFSVNANGSFAAGDSSTVNGNIVLLAANNALEFRGGGAVLYTTGNDTFQWGFDTGTTTASAQTFGFSNPAGANAAGARTTFNGSYSTGSGVGGGFRFQTSHPTGSSSTPNTFTDDFDITTLGLVVNTMTTDATHTTRTVCQDTTSKLLLFGSGTLGICLGTSSARFKHGIADLQPGLESILMLKPKSYYLNADHGDPNKEMYGFIAEDMVKVLPKLVSLDTEGRPNTADYLGVVPVLVKAIQEQQTQIASLRAENTKLRATNDNFDRRLGELERIRKIASK